MRKVSVASDINKQYFKPSFRRKIRSSSTPPHSPFIALTIRHTGWHPYLLRSYETPDFSHFCLLERPSSHNVLAWQINKRPRNKLTLFLFRHQFLHPFQYTSTRVFCSLPFSYTFFLFLFFSFSLCQGGILSLLKVYSLSLWANFMYN